MDIERSFSDTPSLDDPQGEPLTLTSMIGDVAALLGIPVSAIHEKVDLIDLGLDSLGVMRLANIWRRRGANIKFSDLIETRSLAELWRLVSSTLDGPGSERPQSPKTNESAPFDLATMQLAYWVGRGPTQLLGSGSFYYFEFDGHEVEPSRLERALRLAIQRHGMLRARFLGDGRQQILPDSTWPGLTVHDFRLLSADVVEPRLARLREQQSRRCLAVDKGEVFDVHLSQCPNRKTRVHLNIDMLVCDALSFRVLINELAQLYVQPSTELTPISYSYPRYLADKGAANKGSLERAREYWTERLPRLRGGPGLPLAIRPESVAAPRVARREKWLPPAEWQSLSRMSHEHGLTLSMVLMTAFVEILAAWSSEPHFVLNVPFFDREPLHPEVFTLVGDFSSSILLEVDAAGNMPFLERAQELQTRFRADAAQSTYPGVDVLRDLSRFSPNAAATAGTVVFTSTLGMGDLFSDTVRNTFGRLGAMFSQTSQVWLDQQVTELDGGVLINWDAIESLFAEGVLDAMFAAYLGLVQWLGSPLANWSCDLPDLLPSSQREVRARKNSNVRERSNRLLHQGFFEQAELKPDRIALAWGEGSQMSYGELAHRARQVAASLVKKGSRVGDRVAIVLPKGPGQIEAVLGVLYAGGTYVPVGVDQPLMRRRRIYENAGVQFVVTSLRDKPTAYVNYPGGPEILTLEECRSSEPFDTAVPVSPESLAYVIFTSGSTGDPKGVMVPHRAAMNTIEDILHRFRIDENDRVLAVSSLDFDWSVADIFELLSVGGAVVLIGEDARRDAARWAYLVRIWQITIWQSVPALLDMLLTASGQDGLGQSLRLVMLGGDWVGLDQFQRLQKTVPGCRLAALGGITETSIHCTVHEIEEVPAHWKSIPYGVPLSNVKCRVVDSRGRDCPDWVAGELWVGGAGVSDGYCSDSQLTSRQFVEWDGERWYRSGDRARYWPTGVLEFLGRTDLQVKVRGHRIDLGEVQSAMNEFAAVAQSVVVAVGDQSPQLAAALVPASSELHLDAFREFLTERLPPYMIPERISVLDRLPLTENGKIDRAEIQRLLSQHMVPEVFEIPAGEVEHYVADLWAELLAVPQVGRDQSFFALGGDSLVATRLGARLRAAGFEGFDLHRLFETPRLKDFSNTLRNSQIRSLQPRLVLDAQQRFEPFPLTEIQKAYWLGRNSDFTLGGVGSYWYWEFDGSAVDLCKLEEAINQLILRHDMLRAVINQNGTQQVLEEVPRLQISSTDTAPGEADTAFATFRASISHRVMDPSQWPLLEVRALRYNGNRTRIGFGFDYIVLDALSIVIFFSELGTLYKDPAAVLPPISLSFRDYVLSSTPEAEAVSKARRFWEGRIAELPPAPQLPLRQSPELVRQPRFVRRGFRLAARSWQTIKQRARDKNLTSAAVLATAFAEVLSTWSTQPTLTLNVTLFDRRDLHPDMNRIVGDFTSLILVPYLPEPEEGFATAARKFQEEMWLSLEHREFSALSVMRALATQQDRSGVLMPVVFTSTLGIADEGTKLSMPFGDYVDGLSQTPQIWLDNQVIESDGELIVNWDAVDELFPEHMLDSMLSAYKELLVWLGEKDVAWGNSVPDLLPSTQQVLRAQVNTTGCSVSDRLLHEGLFRHATERPSHPALVWGNDQRISYKELADQALSIAGYLRQHNIQPGDAVGVTMPKGPAQIAAVLGVLAAGATYVPVGVDQPELRRQAIYTSAGVRTVLRDLTLALQADPLEEPFIGAPDSLAYVIHTSGSTGQPKGVKITHRAAMNTIDDINARFKVRETDSVLALSELDFDLSVYDIFGLLSAGGTIVLVEDEYRRDPHCWLNLLQRWNVTIWNSVPALLEMVLMSSASLDWHTSLRLALVSGDWVGLDLGPLLSPLAPECRLIALGGATEAAIWSNFFEVGEVAGNWNSVPYGWPLRNQEFRVVSPRGRDCPDWVSGELWIGGMGVAVGYQGDEDLTAKRFVEHLGKRWYKTGDLGRYRPGGILEFLGRTDHQIKLRGHRIELGEIEAALVQHPDIARAMACIVGDNTRTIAACVVPKDGSNCPGFFDLRSFLAARLPAYMIPEGIAEVDTLPLSTNGKLDRKAIAASLLAPVRSSVDETPKGAIEIAVAKVWSRILSVPEMGRSRSFFSLGGDSLLATQMVEILRSRFGVELTLRQLFAAPTVRDLAALVAQQRPDFDEGMEEGVA